ncbi:MAG TPA: PVC-type heme-binding CxxCH protein [Planctomycetaceae bacterium]|nr:PVC-type heme-binding CxxCH protein [Planctomycetaceae bacterium]
MNLSVRVRHLIVPSALQLALVLCAARLAAADEIKLEGHTFTLPAGFEIELIAGPPLVDRPIVADFDEQGRLYVADSSGSNDKVEKQLAEKPHRIMRLEDSDGDGRFDKSVVFADQMMFPEGAMWLDGSLYVAAPPSIWKLTDTDGDGKADRREEWFAGKTLNGCANDLHGPYAGLDGWVYWCKGAFQKQTYDRPGKSPLVTRAAHVFRCRTDGSGIEPVMTGGMDNPVDVVFTPGGERIFTTTFLQHPAGGKRDGLLHAVYGGVHGKVHEVIEDHLRTGEVLPVLAHLGAAAPCGLARYESNVFGDEYRDNLFACCFNMHKVTRHTLEADGATFKSRDEDFLVSDDLDFHPTDVHEDADGSLLVVNTGGWYKLCCPTSQLHKPDVLGAIYRVRRIGARSVKDARGAGIAWQKMPSEKLVPLLADQRPAVRRRAIRELAQRAEAAVPLLTKIALAGVPGLDRLVTRDEKAAALPDMRCNALWTLTRIDHPDARGAARGALSDVDETVRQVAAQSAGLWRDQNAVRHVSVLLNGQSSQNRRAAAEALGRIGDKSGVVHLLRAAQSLDDVPDRVLEHSVIYALIEIDDPQQTSQGLKSHSPATRRAALIALDQMPAGGLTPETAAELLGSSPPVVKEAAAWIVGRHPEWGEALAGYLRARLTASGLTEAESAELTRLLARFSKAPSVQELIAQAAGNASASPEIRLCALRAMARAALKEPPASWVAALSGILADNQADIVEQAVLAARALPAAKIPDIGLVQALLAVADRTDAPDSIRVTALAAVPGGLADVAPATFGFLVANLQPEQDVLLRSSAADVLARAKLTSGQLADLTASFSAAGPLEADRLLPAFKESSDEPVGLKLVAALKESPALTGLRVDAIKTNLAKFPTSVQERAQELYGIINVDAAKQKEKLDALFSSLKAGDIRRGQTVFNSSKAACAACHPFGYLGGNVGPDLTKIGTIRQERDLLEAIVFPSASFVRSFEPVAIVTKSGKTYNGLVKSDLLDEIVLATGPKEEARIARDDIEEMRPSNVSVMPSGLDQQLSPQDLADLIAFLRAAK